MVNWRVWSLPTGTKDNEKEGNAFFSFLKATEISQLIYFIYNSPDIQAVFSSN
jgi:hypothetical protein